MKVRTSWFDTDEVNPRGVKLQAELRGWKNVSIQKNERRGNARVVAEIDLA